MKKNHIAIPIILILIAVYLILSRMHLISHVPFFPILFTVIFAYTAIRGFLRLHFFEALLSLALIGCINDKLLGIEAITPVTLIFACCLIGIALDMLFRNSRKTDDQYTSYAGTTHMENGADGDFVNVDNSFGSISKYVNSGSLREAQIKNSFGECNVYFNNASLGGSEATIRVENTFGQTRIYLPSTWFVTTRQNTAFGNIHFQGHGNTSEDAPHINLILDASFGEVQVIFE